VCFGRLRYDFGNLAVSLQLYESAHSNRNPEVSYPAYRTENQMKVPIPRHRCSEVIMFDLHPLSALPVSIRRKIREAVRSNVLAIVQDPGMGSEMQWHDARLDAVQISRGTKGESLYRFIGECPSLASMARSGLWNWTQTRQGTSNLGLAREALAGRLADGACR
jgi:hypothetical protein